MSLELNQSCQDRLVESISEQLRTVRVTHDVFLEFMSMAGILASGKILPQTGPLKKKLEKYIGDTPLFDFVYETIARDILENGRYNSESESTTLSSIPRYADPNATAKDLIVEFNSLPWNYVVWFELNTTLGQIIREHTPSYTISDRIQIVSPDSTYDEAYPMMSGVKERDENLFSDYNDLWSRREKKQWNQKTTYLRFDTEGFIGKSIKTTPIEDVIATLKAFFGLCLAINFLRIGETRWLWGMGRPIKRFLIVHKQENDKWTLWATHELPQDISDILRRLEVNDRDGKINASQIGGMMMPMLQLISHIFKNAQKAKKLLLAGQWLLDSYISKNDLLSFVQATIAMEILLGEKDMSDIIGIGELLRNRCAYLIGKTHSERERIIDDFEKIYKVRSKIVHRGYSRLTREERFLFQKLQWMCSRVILEEMLLITEDDKRSLYPLILH